MAKTAEYREWLKRTVLQCRLDKEYAEANKRAWKGDLRLQEAFRELWGDDIYQTCFNFKNARLKRITRCRDKIGASIMAGDGYFLTLTFRDDVLSRTNEKTRRIYASRQLKACSTTYVGNIDYGTKNEREHYHALVRSDEEPDLSWWKEHCGFVKIEKIGNTETDLVKVAKYTAKLSSHALKASTSKGGKVTAPRIIYSRKIR